MKKSHLLALIAIAAAVGIIISTTGDASSYVDFQTASVMAKEGNLKSIHIVGELKKDPSGQVLGLEKSADNLSFSFLLIDEQGNEQKVIHQEPLPPDFLRSEKIVIIGHYVSDIFLAEKILLKCPSKYQDNTLKNT
ncbi:MAG: cytochrome c maturation protein CcmE [Bacteroidetes bacterium]|nr:cytochrome c maturation protein CcmE [Bacteroidota bacterium]